MRYLSVCSGIEAASVAWHHLGWQPVGFSEIEPFPSAVLAHRFPNVPNFGDMTRHAEWNLGPGSVDLLVGGTPCQSFSVAGLRKGLSDPRGGLMLTYLEIARSLRPRWIVWENVPGVLSSGSGRDLGAFLGALGELGYGWAYRVLDAQWVRVDRWPKAVPQRRRRVFVVGCLGDPIAAAQVLLERQSVCRDIEKSAKTRESVAADASGGARAGCVTSHDVAPCLETTCHDYSRADGFTMVGAVLQPVGYRWQNDRDGLVEDGTAPACRASTGSSGFHEMNHPVIAQPVAFRKSRRAQSVNDHETLVAAEQANTLNQFDTGERDTHAVAFAQNQVGEVRTGDVSGTLNTNSNASGRNTPMAAVAHAFYSTGGTHGLNHHPEVSPAVKVGSGLGIPSPPAVAFHPTQDPISSSEFMHALGTGNRSGCATAAVAQAMTVRRLTPRECERLQGFPDDWTMIPWRKKPAEDCPDGPRYKALGNSMAVNVMAWIGERIDNYERTGNAVRTEG